MGCAYSDSKSGCFELSLLWWYILHSVNVCLIMSCHSASVIYALRQQKGVRKFHVTDVELSNHCSLIYGKILSLRRKIVHFKNVKIKVQMDVLPNCEQKQVKYLCKMKTFTKYLIIILRYSFTHTLNINVMLFI